MPSNQIQALMNCGCGCDTCIGCCFPWEYQGPNRVPSAIPYTISAASCLDIDNYTCNFQPYFDDNIIEGTCGWCANAPSDCNGSESIPIQGGVLADSGGICISTPCTVYMQFALQCQNPATGTGADSCSGSLKLVVKVNWNAPGSVVMPYPAFGAGDHTLLFLDPLSHECTGEPQGGILAVFDLSVISFACGETYTGGACDGQSSCCEPTACDLTAATLTVG